MKTKGKWLISLLPLLIVSCTTLSTQTSVNGTSSSTTTTTTTQRLSWAERAKTLESIHSFRLAGKIAISTHKDSGSANVNWTQTGEQYRVALTGPLGAGGMILTGHPGSVVLRTGDGKTLNASSPEQLLAKHWGYRLPVSNLKYWVRGLPVRGVAYDGQYDDQNRLVRLRQNGWHVQFSNYSRRGAVDLPDRISITSAALDTKIIVYQWNL